MALPFGVTQPPERVAPGSKTATIRGKTTNAKTGSPVKDVRVTLGLSGHGELAGSATSDTNGGYEIRVAPGLYNLSAARDGFVLTPYLDVANVPVLEFGAGQEAAVDLRLLPGATIAGTVTDVSGAPIANANLQATMKIYRQGKIEFQLRATARTNDRGEYRLTNLPAGRYYLQAGKRGIRNRRVDERYKQHLPCCVRYKCNPAAKRSASSGRLRFQPNCVHRKRNYVCHEKNSVCAKRMLVRDQRVSFVTKQHRFMTNEHSFATRQHSFVTKQHCLW